ncbi:hypothetical protein K470DRAFT_78890 [Piedraia hortae CBS 480.64]|uniref:Uncharacterized protein n=1 Tax=Piedraia hortae CBS 480.64 TaxID=1314780 RepID=A0A6A7BZB7_9PEZI|nr:hypothetical protein K470DRAFT_78890 [Piedraia hortae CBS 480.64]
MVQTSLRFAAPTSCYARGGMALVRIRSFLATLQGRSPSESFELIHEAFMALAKFQPYTTGMRTPLINSSKADRTLRSYKNVAKALVHVSARVVVCRPYFHPRVSAMYLVTLVFERRFTFISHFNDSVIRQAGACGSERRSICRRSSSQTRLRKVCPQPFFAGAVGWRAGKQKSVATSPTKAELKALSNAAENT